MEMYGQIIVGGGRRALAPSVATQWRVSEYRHE